MDILKWIGSKGIFLKFRIGRKPFDGTPKKRTTAYEDIKRKERDNEEELEENYGFNQKGNSGV